MMLMKSSSEDRLLAEETEGETESQRVNEEVRTSYAAPGDHAWILWRPLVSAEVWILFVSSTVHCWRGVGSLGGVWGRVQRKQASGTESKRNIPEAAGGQCPGCWFGMFLLLFHVSETDSRIQRS